MASTSRSISRIEVRRFLTEQAAAQPTEQTNPPPVGPLTGTAEPERKPVKAFRSPRQSTR